MKTANKTFILAMAALLLGFVSCNKSGTTPAVPAGDSGQDGLKKSEIVFRTVGEFDAENQTKASAVTSLSSFSCSAVSAASTAKVVFNGSTFTKDGSTSNYKCSGIYWPQTDQKYTFYASNVSVSATTSTATVSATSATDVVCAYLPYNSSSSNFEKTNALTFNHIFARLAKTTVSVADGYDASNITITITPKTGGTYDLVSGNGKTDGTGWSGTTTGSAVTLATAVGDNAATDTYLVPGSYTLTATYTLTKGDYTETFTGKTKTVSIVGGSQNTITATLGGGDAKDIVFTVTVTAWGTNTVDAGTFGS